jgi:Putative Ig domain
MSRRLPILALAVAAVAGSAALAQGAQPTYPPLRFTIPSRINMTIGKPFSYSFCRPAPKPNGKCGGAGTTNPSGGFGHYYVFHVRFPTHLPPGLGLSGRSGVLSGTPTGPPGITKFGVCVADAEHRPGNQGKCAVTDGSEVNAPPEFVGAWTGTYSELGCPGQAPWSGGATLELHQDGDTLTGEATYVDGFVVGDCAAPDRSDLHATIDGTITSPTTATITSVYDQDQGSYQATLTLRPDGTLELAEEGGDTAVFHRS